MVKLLVFAVLSVALAYISRFSLRLPRSHGFHRFFAWEFILALFLINMDVWFQSPVAWFQLTSWFLLCTSLVLLVQGIQLLTSEGRPAGNHRGETHLYAFERTSSLVTTGIFPTFDIPCIVPCCFWRGESTSKLLP